MAGQTPRHRAISVAFCRTLAHALRSPPCGLKAPPVRRRRSSGGVRVIRVPQHLHFNLFASDIFLLLFSIWIEDEFLPVSGCCNAWGLPVHGRIPVVWPARHFGTGRLLWLSVAAWKISVCFLGVFRAFVLCDGQL